MPADSAARQTDRPQRPLASGAGSRPAANPRRIAPHSASNHAPQRSERGRDKQVNEGRVRPSADRHDRSGAQGPADRPAGRNRAEGPDQSGPAAATPEATARAAQARRKRRRRTVASIVVLALILLLAWPIGLGIWANGKIQHVAALSDEPVGPATTYLLAGSDSRAEYAPDSTVQGARSDTIMLLTVPASGPTSLISLPRDTYAEIPGHGAAKLNAAYSYGGPKLLVATVEKLTGTKVDHYVEVGFNGVENIVDAVGGVRLCLDYNVNDKLSKLKWKKGCHRAGGKKALAFARMRYSDPKGDIGRAERQRQVIAAITKKVKDPSLLWKPVQQVSLIEAGTKSVSVDTNSNIVTLAKLALAFRAANGDGGVRGTPPIKSLNYRPGNVGSTVQLDPKKAPGFFKSLREGTIEPGEVGGLTA